MSDQAEDQATGHKDQPAPEGIFAAMASMVSDVLHLAGGRFAGGLILFLVVVTMATAPSGGMIESLLFDGYQKTWPRERQSTPVVIVEIDEDSLATEGQWPWPRTRIADLVDRIALAGAASIGIDIIFPEPDRMSPAALAENLGGLGLDGKTALRALPDNDEHMAESLALAPTVLALAGLPEQVHGNSISHNLSISGEGKLADHLTAFPDVLHSLPILQEAAAGYGLISGIDEDDGVYRRPLTLAMVNSAPVVSMPLEMLRIASRESRILLEMAGGKPDSLSIGDLRVPINRDGGYRMHFAPSIDEIYVSASDVLAGNFAPERFKDRLVLIGMTGLGLQDYHVLPTGALVPGVEIHAQFLEAILDEAHIHRSDSLVWIEILLAIVGGGILMLLVGRLSAEYMMLTTFAVMAVFFAVGPFLFVSFGIVFNSLAPALAAGVTGLILSGAIAAMAARERRAMMAEIQLRKEESARLKGELEAARKIQLGLLPSAEQVAFGEHRIDLAAFLEPAREVGGDLYDLFFIDKDHLFFMVGDVSGKGVPASLFMAISKSIYKNAVLRRRADIGDIMTEANAEISRDNPELLFITVFAGVIDLRTGILQYCNAGHDNPLLLSAQGALLDRLEDAGGPPLCVLDDFEYESATIRLEVTQSLLVTTDGITEAMDYDGALYGNDRMEATVARQLEGGRANQVVNALLDDVKSHCNGAPASDDTTVMFLRFLGDSEIAQQQAQES